MFDQTFCFVILMKNNLKFFFAINRLHNSEKHKQHIKRYTQHIIFIPVNDTRLNLN